MKVEEQKALLRNHKRSLIWDAFNKQSTSKIERTLVSYGIKTVMVPENMLQLLDPIPNGSFKKF